MSDPLQTEVVQAWLKRARSDLQLGKAALITPGVLPEDACFHAQQCAEKALKALLLLRQISYPRTHSIEVLLDILKLKGEHVPENVDETFILTEYAVQTRYPGEWEPVTQKEAGEALGLARLVLSWVESRIEEF
jgi:HEPN domain-containing protein